MSDRIPLDPDEGPTLWAERTGEHSVTLLQGVDPDDPMSAMVISDDEIERLAAKKDSLNYE
jgi:hypothetical protein